MWSFHSELGRQEVARRWAMKHAFTLIFLSVFGIVAWLVILSIAIYRINHG